MTRTFGSLFLVPLIAAAAPAVRSDMLVSTDWLAQHLKDPKLVVLHVSRDRKAYDAGHIPGARFLALTVYQMIRGSSSTAMPTCSPPRGRILRSIIWDMAGPQRCSMAGFRSGRRNPGSLPKIRPR